MLSFPVKAIVKVSGCDVDRKRERHRERWVMERVEEREGGEVERESCIAL